MTRTIQTVLPRSSRRTRCGKARAWGGLKGGGIRAFFRGASQLFTFAIHYSLNGQIDVQGDTARAQWYLFMPCTLGEGNRAMWRAGIDHEEYVRVEGEWKFKHKSSAPLFHTPFEEGWAKTRFV